MNLPFHKMLFLVLALGCASAWADPGGAGGGGRFCRRYDLHQLAHTAQASRWSCDDNGGAGGGGFCVEGEGGAGGGGRSLTLTDATLIRHLNSAYDHELTLQAGEILVGSRRYLPGEVCITVDYEYNGDGNIDSVTIITTDFIADYVQTDST